MLASSSSRSRSLFGVLTATILVGLLNACSAHDSQPPSPTVSTPDAYFASEADAIAAMKRLISKADDAETLAVNQGDFSEVDRIYRPEDLAEVHNGLQFYIDLRVRLVGTYADRNHRIVAMENRSDGAVVTVTFCRNVAGARLELAEGGDATPPNRPIEQSAEVTGYFSALDARLSQFSGWTEGNACAN